MSLSKSTVKRRLHESKYAGANKAKLDFCKSILWTAKINLVEQYNGMSIGRRFIVQMHDDPKHAAKAVQEVLMVKK